MSKLKPKRDDYERTESGLYLPRGGLVGPDRKRPTSRRMMPGYPCCCQKKVNCTNNANCSFTGHNELLVDLGVGGWANNLCDRCDEVAGEFIVQLGVLSGCNWIYGLGDTWCTESGCSVELRIVVGVGFAGSHCNAVSSNQWGMWVYLTLDCAGSFPITSACYTGSTVSAGNDCFSVFTSGTMNMTKQLEYSGGSTGHCNGGTLPNTVTISEYP